MPIYGVETADPVFYSLGDGYLGLSPKMVEKLHSQGLISERLIGIHTHLYNSTEDPSVIRFGGVNENLIPHRHDISYFDTVSDDSWELEVS